MAGLGNVLSPDNQNSQNIIMQTQIEWHSSHFKYLHSIRVYQNLPIKGKVTHYTHCRFVWGMHHGRTHVFKQFTNEFGEQFECYFFEMAKIGIYNVHHGQRRTWISHV